MSRHSLTRPHDAALAPSRPAAPARADVPVASPHPFQRAVRGRAARGRTSGPAPDGATAADGARHAAARPALQVTVVEGTPLNLSAAAVHYARLVLDALRAEQATAAPDAGADAGTVA